ncbi:MAG: hypothetical protein H7X91_02320 [Burkholderiales bacterium]|nr:hypothetical protein [Burkholderiales bacterium]
MRRLLTVLVSLLLAAATLAMAEPRSVLVVLSENEGVYREAAEALIRALEKGTPGMQAAVRIVPLSALLRETGQSDPGLIVPVGTRAAQAVAALELPVPVLNTLIPSQVYKKIVRAQGVRDRRTFSAVFLDQPLARQLRLIQLLLPRHKRIGVVLSGESVESAETLQAAASRFGFQLRWEAIDDQDQLLAALQRVLADSDVLLTLPDPIVLNRETAQAVLLTSYRYQDPVIAYSQAYVSAGALAAVHTTPAQVGRQTGELIRSWLAGKDLPPPQFPQYCDVSVNYHVARSLGLDIPGEPMLLEKLREAESAP